MSVFLFDNIHLKFFPKAVIVIFPFSGYCIFIYCPYKDTTSKCLRMEDLLDYLNEVMISFILSVFSSGNRYSLR